MTLENVPRCALYARVSTKLQSIDMQIHEMKPYAASRGWQIVNETKYIDRDVSGSKTRRPGLDRLMADATRGKFDVVLVYKFDRFARSVIHLAQALEKFKSQGIDFVSKTEAIDTRTPMGQFVYTILSAVAAMERELIRERVSAGLKKAKAQGVRLGRTPLKDTPRLTAQARELWRGGKGESFRDIGKHLGVSHMTAYNLVKRRAA